MWFKLFTYWSSYVFTRVIFGQLRKLRKHGADGANVIVGHERWCSGDLWSKQKLDQRVLTALVSNCLHHLQGHRMKHHYIPCTRHDSRYYEILSEGVEITVIMCLTFNKGKTTEQVDTPLGLGWMDLSSDWTACVRPDSVDHWPVTQESVTVSGLFWSLEALVWGPYEKTNRKIAAWKMSRQKWKKTKNPLYNLGTKTKTVLLTIGHYLIC